MMRRIDEDDEDDDSYRGSFFVVRFFIHFLFPFANELIPVPLHHHAHILHHDTPPLGPLYRGFLFFFDHDLPSSLKQGFFLNFNDDTWPLSTAYEDEIKALPSSETVDVPIAATPTAPVTTTTAVNQASKQDVEALIDYIYANLGMDLDYILPFAGIPENGH